MNSDKTLFVSSILALAAALCLAIASAPKRFRVKLELDPKDIAQAIHDTHKDAQQTDKGETKKACSMTTSVCGCGFKRGRLGDHSSSGTKHQL